MKNMIDISSLKKVCDEFDAASIKLVRNYDSAWKDKVHDSYAAYNRFVQIQRDKVSNIYSNTKKIVDSIPDDSDLIREARNVISEVRNL